MTLIKIDAGSDVGARTMQTTSAAPSAHGLAALLCGAALMLDGLDNQLLGLLIPSLMKEWRVGPGTFTPFIIETVILMSLGTALAGWLGDRRGRKPMLVVSLLLLGVFTLVSSMAATPNQLLIARGLAAFGMGGVMPNASALLAEHVPHRHRGIAVTIGISSIPLGGVLGGLLGSVLLPHWGWRAMFGAAGLLTLVIATAAMLCLRESPTLRHAQAASSDDMPADRQTPAADPVQAGEGILSTAYRRDTLAMWAALCFSMLGVYSMANWLPTLLAQAGFGTAAASLGLSAFNLGGILGAIMIGVAIDRFGPRRPLATVGIVGALAAVATILVLGGNGANVMLAMALIAMGGSIGGLQAALIAVSAKVYPTTMRAFGMGAMMAFGRMGALASAVMGTLIHDMGSGVFLMAMGAAALISGLSILAVRHTETTAG